MYVTYQYLYIYISDTLYQYRFMYSYLILWNSVYYSLLILLKLIKARGMEAFSRWLFCLPDIVFEHLLTFWHKMLLMGRILRWSLRFLPSWCTNLV